MYKIYSLLSKKAQEYLAEMELREVLDVSFIEFNKNLTPKDKEKLLAVHETVISYSTKKNITHIRAPRDAYELIKPKVMGKEQEELHAIFLNTKNAVVHTEMIFKGTNNSCIVDPKCVYSRALKCSASAVIVLHQHPSGDPTPSQEDIEVTKRLKDVGELINIDFLDHVIIGDEKFVSLKEMYYI